LSIDIVPLLFQAKTFNETCIMVRQPALEVIDCLKNIDFDHTAPRFMLCILVSHKLSLCPCEFCVRFCSVAK
jgi:hypothetical protein